MRKLEFTFLAALFFVFAGFLGIVHVEFQQPSAMADEQINGSGAEYWSIDQAIGSNSGASTQCIHRTDSVSTCALFPAGEGDEAASRATLVTAVGVGRCCWSMDGALQISGARVLESGALGQDAGSGDGQCAGFKIVGTAYEADSSPNRLAMINARSASMRTGLCSTQISASNDFLYPPCDQDADCSVLSAGTCTMPPTSAQMSAAGIFMICRGGTGTSSITFSVRKQRIRKH